MEIKNAVIILTSDPIELTYAELDGFTGNRIFQPGSLSDELVNRLFLEESLRSNSNPVSPDSDRDSLSNKRVLATVSS
jgi:hypothetical protein